MQRVSEREEIENITRGTFSEAHAHQKQTASNFCRWSVISNHDIMHMTMKNSMIRLNINRSKVSKFSLSSPILYLWQNLLHHERLASTGHMSLFTVLRPQFSGERGGSAMLQSQHSFFPPFYLSCPFSHSFVPSPCECAKFHHPSSPSLSGGFFRAPISAIHHGNHL